MCSAHVECIHVFSVYADVCACVCVHKRPLDSTMLTIVSLSLSLLTAVVPLRIFILR